MPASTAGPTITPAVGPWIPTESDTVRANRTLSRRSERRGSSTATLAWTRAATVPAPPGRRSDLTDCCRPWATW